jgi:anti-sigma factor RsiW
MNRDTLERLMMDRALGELEPDIGELLDAHLKNDPQAANEVREITETLLLAKRAFTRASEPALPAPIFDHRILAFPNRPPAARRVLYRISGMAACVATGAFLGILLARQSVLPSAPKTPSEAVAPAIMASSEPGFWSARRLRLGQATLPMAANARVVWKSPVRIPEIKPSL